MSIESIKDDGIYGIENKDDWIEYRNNYLTDDLYDPYTFKTHHYVGDNFLYSDRMGDFYIDFDDIIDFIPADSFFDIIYDWYVEDTYGDDDSDFDTYIDDNLYELVMCYVTGSDYTELEFDNDGSILSIEDY